MDKRRGSDFVPLTVDHEQTKAFGYHAPSSFSAKEPRRKFGQDSLYAVSSDIAQPTEPK